MTAQAATESLSPEALKCAVAVEVMGLDLQRHKSYCHFRQHLIYNASTGREQHYCYTCYDYWSKPDHFKWDGIYRMLPKFTESETLALQVVARLRELNWKWEFRTVWESEWEAMAYKPPLSVEVHSQETFALGVCRVALLAVRLEKGGAL